MCTCVFFACLSLTFMYPCMTHLIYCKDRLLRAHGAETHMMRLQGFLFFATGADMIGCVERRLERGRRGLAPPLVRMDQIN